jgi:hypothetical protein
MICQDWTFARNCLISILIRFEQEIVEKPEDYIMSSARDYAGFSGPLRVDIAY